MIKVIWVDGLILLDYVKKQFKLTIHTLLDVRTILEILTNIFHHNYRTLLLLWQCQIFFNHTKTMITGGF